MEDKTIKNGKKSELYQERRGGLFKKGNPGGGRPKGTKNFKTLFEVACKEVAKKSQLGEEPDNVIIEILKKGIKRALSQDYKFYQDILDRYFGKPQQKLELEETQKMIILDDEDEE